MSDALRVTIPAAPAGPTAPTPPATTPERPTWLPEKFKSAEDMAAAYAALEQKLGTGTTPPTTTPPATTPTTQTPPTTTPPTTTPPPAEPKPAVENLDKYEAEFAESGKLSDESYAALQKAGFGRNMVDAYVQGQVARAEAAANQVFSAVGGKDQYAEMVTWGATAMQPAEVKAYNDAVNSGDPAKMMLAVQGLQTKFAAANGREPTLVGGGRGSAGPAPFDNWAQVTAAMRDPRYATDGAYRKTVEDRIARSSVL